jgi:4-amino-4-deoxychorismate lyase
MAVPLTPDSFQIISSLRYDPALPDVASIYSDGYPVPLRSPYYLLAYHRDRLITAAHFFQWDKALDWLQQDLASLETFLDAKIPDRQQPWRLRIVVDCNGKGSVDVHATPAMNPLNLLVPSVHPPTESIIWRVFVDTQATYPSGFTTHKTTAREDYTAARLRAGIESPADTAEVLIVNHAGEIMEGSITTPYFRARGTSDQAWFTPPLSSGGNDGTTRRYALTQGFCTERTLDRAELIDGEECWLSNGVRGFLPAVIVLKRSPGGTLHAKDQANLRP